jgi:hypothetical protein
MKPSPELQLLNSFENDNTWLNSNYNELQKEHPNQFVAIDKEKVVGSNEKVEKLVETLKSKKIDTAVVLIEFIPQKGLKIIL